MNPRAYAMFLAASLLFAAPAAATTRPNSGDNPKIDFPGFLRVASEVEAFRSERRVTEEQFLRMAAEPGTLILDTRSAAAYRQAHLKGAVHLNFSDFTKQNLAETIPSKQTRILIYCNNNFESERPSLFDKRVRAALNIPTFITLYEYGYRNLYELGPVLDEQSTRLILVTGDDDQRE